MLRCPNDNGRRRVDQHSQFVRPEPVEPGRTEPDNRDAARHPAGGGTMPFDAECPRPDLGCHLDRGGLDGIVDPRDPQFAERGVVQVGRRISDKRLEGLRTRSIVDHEDVPTELRWYRRGDLTDRKDGHCGREFLDIVGSRYRTRQLTTGAVACPTRPRWRPRRSPHLRRGEP